MFGYDYFEEYSDFDAQIEEFKESLRNQVKEEIKNKIEKLEKRNKELEERQKNLVHLEAEYKNKLAGLALEKQWAVAEAKKEYLMSQTHEIVDKLFECRELYKIDKDFVRQDKCPHCDENRRLTIKDVFGREHKIACKCLDTLYKYFVTKANTKISCCKKVGDSLCFKVIASADSCGYETVVFEYMNGEPTQNNIFEKFDENNLPPAYYSVYFTSEEEAQKYAEYLNQENQYE